MGRTEGWRLTGEALARFLAEDGRVLAIFDGLDEIVDPEERERITRQIAGFAMDHRRARVLATSRVIGYRRKILADAGFVHLTLEDLDEAQVAAFAAGWYALVLPDRPVDARLRTERVLAAFRQSASIRQLASNPMLLTIMAIIGRHQELPRERWKLYDHAASVLIQHWDVNKHLRDRKVAAEFIGEDDKKELLRRLAWRMQAGGAGFAGNYIPSDLLQQEFEDYLRQRYAQPPDRAALAARALVAELRERNFILSLHGANLYGFVHRAFLEYFCASALVHRFEKTRELSLDDLKRDIFGAHWAEPAWQEVLRLVCGMIAPRFAGELIAHLTSEVNPYWTADPDTRPPVAWRPG
jgi:predicted NACHT family NTPase